MSKHFDFIIAGGGSAGCVLANRLSHSGAKVVVIEAGRKDYLWDLIVHMPAALSMPIGSPRYDWGYYSDPEPSLQGRRVYHARGKLLGGSSSINGMIFQRGNPKDYERWAADPGMGSWSFSHCLPYFKRMESSENQESQFRGSSGPLVLERGQGSNPLNKAFLAACAELDYPLTDDVNGFRQEGFSSFDRNIRKGRRLSAARAYYHPVADRPNLSLITKAHIVRVICEKKRAVGLEFCRGRRRFERITGGEIILCAGAFGSPQLLQLSGIGPAADLEKLDIPIVEDLAGVGQNLQDHLEVYVQHRCKKPVSLNPYLSWWRKPGVGLRWISAKSGVAASNHFETGGFLRSNASVAYPNLMFHFLPLAVRYDGTRIGAKHGYQVHVGPMYSDARGRLKLRSSDPFDPPSIRFNYLSTVQDRREWIEAITIARKILSQSAMSEFNGGEISPGPTVASPERILEWVARDAETALHPSCTCKMGQDALSVLDPSSLKVWGLEALRIVDASSMPYITNGNIYAPVMMLAEKASDLILGNTPLAPEEVPYFSSHAQLGI